MGTKRIQQQMTNIAEQAKLLTAEDVRDLAKVYAQIERVAEDLRDTNPTWADIAEEQSALINAIIMDECDDVPQALKHLGQALSTLAQEAAHNDTELPKDATQEQQSDTTAEAIPFEEESEDPITTMVDANKDVEEESNNPELLETISADIMMVGLDDLSVLGNIHNKLEKVFELNHPSNPISAAICQALMTGIDAIILDECPDAITDPLEVIALGIDTLQRLQQSMDRTQTETIENPDVLTQLTELSGEDLTYFTTQTPTETTLEPTSETTPQESTPEATETPSTNDTVPKPPTPHIEIQKTDLSSVDPDVFADFMTESEEHLETAESVLLELESNSEDKDILDSVFRAFHTIKGTAGFLSLHEVVHVAHSVEDILDSARRDELKITPKILDVALASIDILKTQLSEIESGLESGQANMPDVTQFLQQVAAVSGGEDSSESAASQQAPAGAQPTNTPNETTTAPTAPPTTPQAPSPSAPLAKQQHVRVGTEKLDELINMVGELVIAQTQINQHPSVLRITEQKLTKDMAQLTKIANDLQGIAMSMRMVPIKGTFERMARLVRDLSRKCGKDVAFQMMGEETELDKNVVEEILDPLTHMVRNAVDHGLETAEERKQTDKPAKGTITLEAYHKGGNIVIELRDDGRGLNRDKILKKATERGLVSPDETLTDDEIFNLIFLPGFSTAEQISDISGRGVGMDVVRRNIERLRGRAEVTSTPGQGSVFTIRLPLTLAIIDGMIIGVGNERYILPLTSIISTLRPTGDQMFSVMHQEEMVKVQDELYPLQRLHKRFEIDKTQSDPTKALVMIVESEGKRCALLVDELVGMQQVVIKGLEENLRQDKCFSGCAILGDGQVGLIIDVNHLIDSVDYKIAS